MNARQVDRTFSSFALGFIPVSIALLAGCLPRGGGAFTPFATVSKERQLADDIHGLVVTTRVGGIVISPSAGADLKIEAVVKVRADRVDVENAGTAFEDHVSVSEQDGVLTIEDAHRDRPDREDWSVTLTVATPRALAVSAATGVGDVDVQSAAGEVKAQTGVGGARLSAGDVAGASVTSGTGNVDVAVGMRRRERDREGRRRGREDAGEGGHGRCRRGVHGSTAARGGLRAERCRGRASESARQHGREVFGGDGGGKSIRGRSGGSDRVPVRDGSVGIGDGGRRRAAVQHLDGDGQCHCTDGGVVLRYAPG
jgi:hypothetical protein